MELSFISIKELQPWDFQNYFEMPFLTATFSKFKPVCILKHDYRNACKPNQKFELTQNKLNGCILAVAI